MKDSTPTHVDSTPTHVDSPTAQCDYQNELTTPNVQQPTLSSTPVVTPLGLLYWSWLFGLIPCIQYGWKVSELNLSAYNDKDDCKQHPVEDGKCLMFPGHTPMEWTVVVNAWILGGAIGGLFSGPPMDKLGRRRAFALNSVVMILGGALQGFAPKLWMMVLGRFVSGIASGFGLSLTSVYNSEIAPVHIRSALCVGLQVSIVFGIWLVACALFGAGSERGWRVITGMPIVFGAINLVGALLVTVESPRWFLSHGRTEDAREALRLLFGEEQVEVAFKELALGCTPDVEEGVCTNVQDNSDNDSNDSSWSLLFREYKRSLMVVLGVCLSQQLSGINAVFYYSSDIFKDAGVSDSRVGTVIICTVNLVTTLGSVSVINRLPKRRMLLVSAFVMLLSCCGMTLSFLVSSAALSIAFTALYVGSFEFGFGPLPFMLGPELFPNSVRANGMSCASFVNSIGNLLVGVFFPYVSDALTKDFSFVPFIVFLALSLVFMYFCVPETANKTLEEIQLELNGGGKKPDMLESR